MKKYIYIGAQHLNFTLGEIEVNVQKGDEINLPEDHSHVKELVANGYFKEAEVSVPVKKDKELK